MRVILVPLGGDDHDRAALAAAHAIADRFRSHIEGLFVRPDVLDAIADLEGGSPEIIGSVKRATSAAWDKRAARARATFDEAQASADAALAEQPTGSDSVTVRFRDLVGRGEDVITHEGRLADLLVFAGVRSFGDRDRGPVFAQALVASARPVLLTPTEGPPTAARTIALSWNGSAESTRALTGAIPLLLNAERVHILTAASAHTEVERGRTLSEYLAWHGLMSEVHSLFPEGNVGAALLAKAGELGADLMVMGGYGRSRFSELIFGGVTRHVLGHYQLPVLIAH
jgi:nucleotide-binding universal stress UspA family protein